MVGFTDCVLENETNLLLLSSIESDSSAFSPQLSRYTFYAITAPYKGVSRVRECG
jgi:hypothetical protein